MTVVLALSVVAELDAIWCWNAEHYGVAHADAYIGFLKQTIDDLASTHGQGPGVPRRPDLQYILVRRKRRGHGHVAVYAVAGNTVEVLHVFHTAQDWQNRVADATP